MGTAPGFFLPTIFALRGDPAYGVRGVVMEKITYASLGNLGEDFHRSFDAALVHERKKLGDTHPLFINGKPVKAGKTFIDTNPANRDLLLGKFQCGSREHVRKAIAAAKNASTFWQELGWPNSHGLSARAK